MEELELFPKELAETVELFIVHFNDDCFKHGLELLQELRKVGVASDIYPQTVKIQKQFNYADKIRARNVVVIGEDEIKFGYL